MMRTAKLAESKEAENLLHPHAAPKPIQPISFAVLVCSLFGAFVIFVNVLLMQEKQDVEALEVVEVNTTTVTTTILTTSTNTTTILTETITTTPLNDVGRLAALTASKEGRNFACGTKDWCDLPFMGVNIGGWLVMEDDLWPAEMKDQGIGDEWTFIQHLGGPTSPRAVKAMKEHWETFITDKDLDDLRWFGITHVRVPVGYWLVDYNQSDGFVYRGQLFLFRFLGWLKQRGMKAVIVLQAVPGGQAVDRSSTGRRTWEPEFFLDRELYERGQRAMYKLAEWIAQANENPLTEGTVVGLELLNEPDWQYWSRSPGIRELYETMVPKLRKLLPARKCAFLLSFQEPMLNEGLNWLTRMRYKHPDDYTSVFYDAHISHVASQGATWHVDANPCKTCCRDPLLLKPLEMALVPVVIGEYSLDTALHSGPQSWPANVAYFRNQLSLWANSPGVLGSFFWNHRVLTSSYSRMNVSLLSLLDLIKPDGPLYNPWNVSHMDVVAGGLCPDVDLTRCPHFHSKTVRWTDECHWKEG